MHERIQQEIERVERDCDVRVIYACESGSRAWGFPSRDSDYDVRMVYHHPLEWYLSLQTRRDVIERPITDALDISGWDIRKTLALLRKSNPNILEWSRSPILYRRDEKFSVIESLLEISFRPQNAMRHYLSMARNTRRSFLERPEINVKKYLYTIRPLMCARWIAERNSQPPMLYRELMEAVLHSEPDVTEEIELLVVRKQELSESDVISRNHVLHAWIEREFEALSAIVPDEDAYPEWSLFQDAFYKTIGFAPA